MNTRLKESVALAENELPQEGQEKLADLVDSFTAHYGMNFQNNFTVEELAELKQIEQSELAKANPSDVATFFAKYGL